jgi:hypothetical protein
MDPTYLILLPVAMLVVVACLYAAALMIEREEAERERRRLIREGMAAPLPHEVPDAAVAAYQLDRACNTGEHVRREYEASQRRARTEQWLSFMERHNAREMTDLDAALDRLLTSSRISRPRGEVRHG